MKIIPILPISNTTNKKITYGIELFVVFVALVCICSIPARAYGQEAQRTITIVPPSLPLTLNPGDRTEGVLKVINDSNQPLTFTASTQDFIVEDTKGTPDFVPQDTFGKPYSGASWIGIVPDNFTVNPGQKEMLAFYVQVPKNARPGGHYAGVIYTPTSSFGSKSSGPAVQTQIGTLFSIDITGPIHEEALVSTFRPEHGFYEYGPVNVLTQVKNLGDLHIKPIGTITIYDIFGRKLAVLPLSAHNIFPQAARDFVNVFGQHWMVGPFTAKFAANYGRSDNLTLLASTTFWVFPWKVTIVILLAIIAGVLGYFVWKRRKGEKEHPPIQENNPKIPNIPTTPTAQ